MESVSSKKFVAAAAAYVRRAARKADGNGDGQLDSHEVGNLPPALKPHWQVSQNHGAVSVKEFTTDFLKGVRDGVTGKARIGFSDKDAFDASVQPYFEQYCQKQLRKNTEVGAETEWGTIPFAISTN